MSERLNQQQNIRNFEPVAIPKGLVIPDAAVALVAPVTSSEVNVTSDKEPVYTTGTIMFGGCTQ